MINNIITINSKKHTLEITKTFEKAASRYGSDAYNQLCQARKDFPNYSVVVVRHKIASTSLKGLTYEYMEKYICAHDDEAGTIMAEYKDFRAISAEAIAACADTLSYGKIKAWFLKKYPEIKNFHERRRNS